MNEPKCPACGDTRGVLGTSNAYWICRNPDCPSANREVYWINPIPEPGKHPVYDSGYTWEEAIKASPFGQE